MAVALFGALAFAASRAQSQTSACRRLPFELLRYEEDYSFLSDPACRARALDELKYVPLRSRAYLSVGADLRERYEYIRHPDWGRDPADASGYILHRFMVHGDLRVGSAFRTFVQFKSALLGGRSGGARVTDQDTLDLHQAFVDVTVGDQATLTIRAGRQEVAYGSSRLISVREGPNVRRSFDGVRLMYVLRGFQFDALGLSAVDTKPGIFDDGAEDGNWLWGLYATGPFARTTLHVDLYYLALRRPRGEYERGIAREVRHSMGLRAFGALAQVDYDFEFVYQFGRFGDDGIAAWTAASDTGYTLHSVTTRPRLGLRANITSGDRGSARGDLSTFNPLYPRGNYFGEASLLGPMNHRDIHPTFAINPSRELTLSVDFLAFFRDRPADALYRVSGAPQVDATLSGARYVGSQAAINFEWAIDPHVSLLGTYLHFFPGAFLRESGLGKHVDFIALWMTCRL